MRKVSNLIIVVLTLIFSCSSPSENNSNKDDPSSSEKMKIAFTSSSSSSNHWTDTLNIYMMNEDGTERLNLTNNSAYYYDIKSSPTDEVIVFISNFENDVNFTTDLYLMNVLTKNIKNLSNTQDDYEADPKFTSDGKTIFFQSTRQNGNYQLFSMNRDGTDIKAYNSLDEKIAAAHWDISEDGKYLIYSGKADGYDLTTYHVFIRETNEDGLIDLTPDFEGSCFVPVFAPDSLKIYFKHTSKAKKDALYKMNIDGSEKEIVMDYEADIHYGFMQFTPDGKNIFFRAGGDDRDLLKLNLDSLSFSNISGSDGIVQFHQISLNGSQIIYASTAGLKQNLYIYDILTGTKRLLECPFKSNRDPVFLNLN